MREGHAASFLLQSSAVHFQGGQWQCTADRTGAHRCPRPRTCRAASLLSRMFSAEPSASSIVREALMPGRVCLPKAQAWGNKSAASHFLACLERMFASSTMLGVPRKNLIFDPERAYRPTLGLSFEGRNQSQRRLASISHHSWKAHRLKSSNNPQNGDQKQNIFPQHATESNTEG